MPRLTIGMATFNDFNGVYFTIQSLRLQYPELFRSGLAEIVVVDQSTNQADIHMVAALCGNTGARHILMPSPTGTSPSRNRVFAEAQGDFVLCVDSHVLLRPAAILDLLGWMNENPDSHDLIQGPMIMDDLKGICTHFNPEWRAEMFGTWGRAWRCRCSYFYFSCLQRGNEVVYKELTGDTSPIDIKTLPRTLTCPKCSAVTPELEWPSHEAQLEKLEFYSSGSNPGDQPFEIPGQGLGLFGCFRSAWLMFNQHAFGFGAEEMNIHELYRQKGHKTLCMPFLQWVHRFGRPGGVPYPLDRYQKVRNYVLWHVQLGKILDDIYFHFVATRLMAPEQWNYLVADPINHTAPEAPPQNCGTCNGQAVPDFKTVDEAFDIVRNVPRDFDQHMLALRSFANRCETVTELSIRRESALALLASTAKMVVSYNSEDRDGILTKARAMRKGSLSFPDPMKVQEIGETDLLFLNDQHTGERILWQLKTMAPKVKHYIVLHNTGIFGEQGEGGTPGLLVACRQFMRERPEWSVVHHSADQYGLTVMSCQAEDKKQLPGKARMLTNFAKAFAEHVMDAGEKVDDPTFESRLDVCATCPQRNEMNCGACGCALNIKAAWRSSECPLGFWPLPVLQ